MENEVKILTKAIELYGHLQELQGFLYDINPETETAENRKNVLLDHISNLSYDLSFFFLFSQNEFLENFLVDIQGALEYLERDNKFKNKAPSELLEHLHELSDLERDQLFKKYYKGA